MCMQTRISSNKFAAAFADAHLSDPYNKSRLPTIGLTKLEFLQSARNYFDSINWFSRNGLCWFNLMFDDTYVMCDWELSIVVDLTHCQVIRVSKFDRFDARLILVSIHRLRFISCDARNSKNELFRMKFINKHWITIQFINKH